MVFSMFSNSFQKGFKKSLHCLFKKFAAFVSMCNSCCGIWTSRNKICLDPVTNSTKCDIRGIVTIKMKLKCQHHQIDTQCIAKYFQQVFEKCSNRFQHVFKQFSKRFQKSLQCLFKKFAAFVSMCNSCCGIRKNLNKICLDPVT